MRPINARRGELWSIAGGFSYAGKPRPALVLQADALEEVGSVIVVPLTSLQEDTPYVRPLVEPSARNGLRVPSRIMVDKITAVPRANLGHRLGQVGAEVLADVERAVQRVLGFGTG